MSGHCCVPEDIVEEILHRLPPKSIGKCMAVCKSWNLLIKSHRFSSSYQPRSLSTPLFLVEHSHYQYSLCSPTNIESSFSIPRRDLYTFVGAVNGLVCLTSYWKMKFILFSPLTRRHLQLPISQTLLCNSCGDSKKNDFNMHFGLRYGFGFDSKKNDFKVVHIGHTGCCFKVELYSLNEGAWRVLINTPFEQDLFRSAEKCCGEQLFFHDSVHWLACETNICEDLMSVHSNFHIVMFNVVEEKFSKMDLPEVLAWSYRKLDITVIDGCLSVVEYPQQPRDNTNIWMKREESWSKIYSLSLSRGNIRKLLGQSMSSEVLVLLSCVDNSCRKIKSLHSYDLNSQEMSDLGVKSRFIHLRASDFTYSLFMLEKESNAMFLCGKKMVNHQA
ncbi:F-box/kelch-repeat protein At3g23880-like [Gastrolobium bilobum]|uniref:F-box/kelch-repeat protein At3g23880-like n=1 Tax=Gastrolobium bilobum TaxID=150636 RepID=UPI002AAFC064|nr:F-box/kelch-repeat protein At3g23880-like [Gastrolobium bilobum]